MSQPEDSAIFQRREGTPPWPPLDNMSVKGTLLIWRRKTDQVDDGDDVEDGDEEGDCDTGGRPAKGLSDPLVEEVEVDENHHH